MGDSGKVMLLPRGEYYSATPYEELDCVYYQGRSYVCKQANTGHAPTDTTYWQPMTPDASAEIQALTNQLTDEVNTRAKLGAHNILNFIPTQNVTADGNTANYDYAYDSDTASYKYTSKNQYYGRVSYLYSGLMQVGESYRLSFTAKCVKGGTDNANISVFEDSIITDNRIKQWTTNTGEITSDFKDFEVEFTATSAILAIQLYIKVGSAAGENSIYIKNIQLALASDQSSVFTPYAMTNKELTDAKIDASQIAPIENDSTASTSYAQGAYFIHNGKFCKAKTSISSGATFTKGTNYEETTVAAELIALAQ